MNTIRPLGILLLLLLFIAPAMAADAGSQEIVAIVNEVIIHPSDEVKQLGYTVNGEANLDQLIVTSRTVSIVVHNVPAGNEVIARIEAGGEPDERRENPLVLDTFPVISTHVYLSLAQPLPKSDTPSQGGSVIVNPTVAQPQGIYTATIENGGTVQFSSDIVFQVIMPDEYSGTVVLTTYKTPLSFEETDVYHQCDIRIEGALTNGETATVRFKVPLSVLDARGFGAADACLYFLHDDEWVECQTVYEVRGDIVYYEAVVHDFGTFMVVFEKDAAEPAISQTELLPSDVESPGFGAVVVTGALGAILAFRRKR